MSATASIIGGAIVWSISLLRPPLNINYAVVGQEGSGKTTLHKSIRKNLGEVHDNRNPTKIIHQRIRAEVIVDGAVREKSFWIGQDFPHHARLISQQVLGLWPRIIFVVLDHQKALSQENEDVLRALSYALASDEYRKKTTPLFTYKWPVAWNIWSNRAWTKKPFHSKDRCRNIVIIDNKMDLIGGNGQDREREVRRILEHYLREEGPLSYVRDKFSIQYIAASLKYAVYLPIGNLSGEPQPIANLFRDLIRRASR